MKLRLVILPLMVIAAGAVQGCQSNETATMNQSSLPAVTYKGVKTSLLDDDMVQFHVTAQGGLSEVVATTYAECAAAQYTLIRGYGFARHIRTNVNNVAGDWVADAVYLISPALPRGLKTIDAEVVAANCAVNEIPMV